MRIAINGSPLLPRFSLERVVEHVRQAAEQGFPTYWLAQAGAVDVMIVLSLVGQRVPGIELGTAVVPTYTRHPAVLASQAMTTQAATDGRLALGIGLSHKPVIEDRYGMSFDRPIRHMREYLSILLPLIQEGKVSFAGETLSANTELAVPGTEPCSVLLAALGPQMLRLAGSRADGTILWMTGPKTIRDHIVPRISEAAAVAGRPAPRIVSSQPICVTEDLEATRTRAVRTFEMYGQLPSYRAMLDREGVESPIDACLFGSRAEVGDRIAAIIDAGASEFSAVEFSRTDEQREATRELLRSLL